MNQRTDSKVHKEVEAMMGSWSCTVRDDRIRQGLQIITYSFALADELDRMRIAQSGVEMILEAVKRPCDGCGVTDCQKCRTNRTQL